MMKSQYYSSGHTPFKKLLISSMTFVGAVAFSQSANGYVAQSGAAKSNVPQSKSQAVPVKAVPVIQAPVVKDLSRADFIQLMDAEFRKRDLDGNGKATRAEVEEHTKRATTATAQEQNRMLFQRLDTDGNGAVNPAEFTLLVSPPKFIDVSPEMIRFDSNRDQIITLVEYRTATLVNFDRLDLDKDGILAAVELSKMTTPPPKVTTKLEPTR